MILTLDVGTSSIRTMLFNDHAVAVPGIHAAVPTDLRVLPDGGVEMDADVLVERAVSCLEQAGRDDVDAIAVTTFWHGILGVGRDGNAVTPVFTWADTRAEPDAASLRRDLRERSVHARTGCVLHSSYVPARLRWLRRTDPKRFGRVWRWMSPGEYLYLKLFGSVSCSLSMATASGLFDQRRGCWDAVLLERLGVASEQLSPVVDFKDAVRGLKLVYARRLPGLASVPWFPAVGDGACSNVGCGAVNPQTAALMVGTSGALRVLHAGPYRTPPPGLWSYAIDAGRRVVGGALSNGGNVFEWMSRTLQLGTDVEAQLSRLEPDGHGLTVLPFLAGERSPHWRGDARAAVVGLSWSTPAIHILQASLEAVAYRFSLLAERLPEAPEEIIATGGALLRSPWWIQVMADVLDRPVVASAEPEASSRGVALLALEALGRIPSLATVPARRGRVFEPDTGRHDAYRKARERHERLYRKLIGT